MAILSLASVTALQHQCAAAPAQRLITEGEMISWAGGTITAPIKEFVLAAGSNGVGGFVGIARFDLNTEDFTEFDTEVMIGRPTGAQAAGLIFEAPPIVDPDLAAYTVTPGFDTGPYAVPAISNAGQVTYVANGSYFDPEANATFARDYLFRDSTMLWKSGSGSDPLDKFFRINSLYTTSTGEVLFDTSGKFNGMYTDPAGPELLTGGDFFGQTFTFERDDIDLGGGLMATVNNFSSRTTVDSFGRSSNGKTLFWVKVLNSSNGGPASVSSSNDEVVLLNGAVPNTPVGLLREGSPSVGLGGAAHQMFDFMRINNNGNWFLTGDTAASSNDDFVLFNGAKVVRETDTVPGGTLSGNINVADMNETDDWVTGWGSTTTSVNTIYLSNGTYNQLQKIVALNDVVSTGPSTTGLLTSIRPALELSERLTDGTLNVFFQGRVDSGTVDSWFVINVAPNLAPIPTALPGDFNGDLKVDAADYTTYRDNIGTNFNLNGAGDETGPSAGIVDAADYALWVLKFGTMAPAAATAVPEPAALVVMLTLVCCLRCVAIK